MRDRGGRGARRAGGWSSRPFSRRRPGFPASARDAPTRGARTPSCLAYVCRPRGPTTCVLCRVANPLDFRALDLSRLVSPGCGSPRAGPGRCASGCAPRLGAAGPGCPAPVIKRRLLGPGPELGTPAAGCPSCSLSGVRAGARDRPLRGALGRWCGSRRRLVPPVRLVSVRLGHHGEKCAAEPSQSAPSRWARWARWRLGPRQVRSRHGAGSAAAASGLRKSPSWKTR